MKSLKCTLVFVFAFVTTLTFAQESNKSWLGGHLTFRAVIQGTDVSDFTLYDADVASLGLSFRSATQERWFQEIALISLNVDRQREAGYIIIPGRSTTSFERWEEFKLSVITRYEYGRFLGDIETYPIVPAISLSVDPYLNYEKFTSDSGRLSSGSIARIGAHVNIIPRFIINISRKLSLDINAPIRFYNVYHTGSADFSEWTSKLKFDEMSLRLGLLYRLK